MADKICCDDLELLLNTLNKKFKRPCLFDKMGINVMTGKDTRMKLCLEQSFFFTFFRHCPMCGKDLNE